MAKLYRYYPHNFGPPEYTSDEKIAAINSILGKNVSVIEGDWEEFSASYVRNSNAE